MNFSRKNDFSQILYSKRSSNNVGRSSGNHQHEDSLQHILNKNTFLLLILVVSFISLNS